jgi:hypothetical protein
MRTSEGMREALQKQDSIKMYNEFNYPIEDASHIFPYNMVKQLVGEMEKMEDSFTTVKDFRKLQEKIQESQLSAVEGENTNIDKNQFEKDIKSLSEQKKLVDQEVRAAIVGMTPFYEEIIKIADEEDLQISQKLLTKMILEGMKADDAFEAQGFTRKTLGVSNPDNLELYLAKGEAQLEMFFNKYDYIRGPEMLPYIIAYGAGKLHSSDSISRNISESLRNWLAESIPVPDIDRIWENGEWVTKETKPTERGFGYVLKAFGEFRNGRNRDKAFDVRDSQDKGWVTALDKADGIVNNIINNMKRKEKDSNVMYQTFDKGKEKTINKYPLREVAERFGLPRGV